MGPGQTKSSRFRVEAPTVILAIAIYGGWIATTILASQLPWPLVVVCGGWFVAWHGSLQHEVIHGHPTRFRWINDALGFVPLSLWLPYAIYRRSHLRHHHDERLTDPIEDPESAYLTPERWRRIGPAGRLILRFDATLPGRLLIGPAIMIVGFLAAEAARILRGDRSHLGAWFWHLLGVAGVLAWVTLVSGMPVWFYLAAFVYPGAALTRLRSFAEHRWSEAPDHRTAIVESPGPLSLLFLNNNLHVLHHARPAIPWYALPAAYARDRAQLLEKNGGLLYAGYLDVARRFFFRSHDVPVHPVATDSGHLTPVRDIPAPPLGAHIP